MSPHVAVIVVLPTDFAVIWPLFTTTISSLLDFQITLSVVLEVREHNQKAFNFYKKQNFNVISMRKHYYKNGDNALVMMKEIKWLY